MLQKRLALINSKGLLITPFWNHRETFAVISFKNAVVWNLFFIFFTTRNTFQLFYLLSLTFQLSHTPTNISTTKKKVNIGSKKYWIEHKNLLLWNDGIFFLYSIFRQYYKMRTAEYRVYWHNAKSKTSKTKFNTLWRTGNSWKLMIPQLCYAAF